MAARAVGRNVHVLGRIGPIGERPQHRVGVGRVDVLTHRDADLAAVRAQGRSAVQRTPHLGARRAVRELHEDHRPHVAQRLVQAHRAHALDAEVIAQVGKEHRLVRDLLDHARFARRHLADDRAEYRRPLHRDRGHLHRHVEVFQRDVAVALAERAFRLEQLGIDQPLDHDLGIGRHRKIDRDALRDADRRAGERAGDRHLVLVDRKLLGAGEHDDRRAADDDRARHRRLHLAVLLPVHDSRRRRRCARPCARRAGRSPSARRGRCPCSGCRIRDRA